MTIDAKSFNSKWAELRAELNPLEKADLEEKLVSDIARTSSALKQNKDSSHAIEFAHNEDLTAAKAFFTQIANGHKNTAQIGCRQKFIWLTASMKKGSSASSQAT